MQQPHAVPAPVLDFGKYATPMLFRTLVVFVLLFGPAYVIAYIVSTRYGRELLRLFPFLRGEVSRAVVLIWLFIAVFTYLPALLRFWLRP